MSDCTQQLDIIFIIYFLERDATVSIVNTISSYAGVLILGNRICIKLSLHGLTMRLISLRIMQAKRTQTQTRRKLD